MPYYYCLKCEEGIYGNKKFCWNCGNSVGIKKEFRCENNHNISKFDKFCSQCGGKKFEIQINTQNEILPKLA